MSASSQAKKFIHYAQCPNCFTIFGIRANQLNFSNGRVRCGNCFQLFYAPDSIVKKPQSSLSALSPKTKANVSKITPIQAAERYQTPLPVIHNDPENNTTPHSTPKHLPAAWAKQASRQQQHSIKATLIWGLLAGLLLVWISSQAFWHNRVALAKYPELASLLNTICSLTDCQLPPPTATDKIIIQTKDLRSHPHFQNALRLHAIVSNEADFAQPFTMLKLSFTDINGRKIAQRVLKPEQYLDFDPNHSMMPPHTPIHLMLDLVDPGPKAVGYTLAFQ